METSIEASQDVSSKDLSALLVARDLSGSRPQLYAANCPPTVARHARADTGLSAPKPGWPRLEDAPSPFAVRRLRQE